MSAIQESDEHHHPEDIESVEEGLEGWSLNMFKRGWILNESRELKLMREDDDKMVYQPWSSCSRCKGLCFCFFMFLVSALLYCCGQIPAMS